MDEMTREEPNLEASDKAGKLRRDRSAIDSRDLFAHTREVTILHEDAQYRLRLTSNNKLILTK
uniref:Hemin uptake protein hemP n=2 Tax=Aureimonas frigidaquae TaxID=424757 RepID=A0A0P0Z0Y3_9HYPH|nr:hemin uptake protein hemP precursor [Aureimonas frigidaquae]